jgi:hypothetical protein
MRHQWVSESEHSTSAQLHFEERVHLQWISHALHQRLHNTKQGSANEDMGGISHSGLHLYRVTLARFEQTDVQAVQSHKEPLGVLHAACITEVSEILQNSSS